MDAWWFVSTDLAGNYFDLSCGERKERRYCQDFSLSPVTTQHLLHGCMLRHETAPSFKRITSLPPSAAAYLEEAILTLNRKPSKSMAIVMSTRDLETNGIVINHQYFLAEPLGSNIRRNPTLYHMTGPFPPLEYWFKAACSNQKLPSSFTTSETKFSPRGLVLTRRWWQEGLSIWGKIWREVFFPLH